MPVLEVHWIALATLLLSSFSVLIALRVKRLGYSRRIESLDVATDLLKSHFQAGERLMSDPAVSVSLKEFLLVVSAAIGHRETALGMAGLQDRKFMDAVGEEILVLNKHRPDLLNDLDEFFLTGLLAMMIRWPRESGL